MKIASASSLSANRFQRRRGGPRRELITAATRVLAEKGLHDTKVTDIAAAADVGVGTFYLHFPDKEALFHAVVEETAARLKAAVDAAREQAHGPVDQMLAANTAFCAFAEKNRELFKIVFGHAAAYDAVIRRAQARFAADIEATFREGVTTGAFTALPAAAVAQAVIGMATQMLSWWAAHEAVPIQTVHDTLSTMALRALCATPPTSPDKGVSDG